MLFSNTVACICTQMQSKKPRPSCNNFGTLSQKLKIRESGGGGNSFISALGGGSLSPRPAWSTEFPGQPELNKQNKQKKEKAVNIANQRKQITEEEKGLKS